MLSDLDTFFVCLTDIFSWFALTLVRNVSERIVCRFFPLICSSCGKMYHIYPVFAGRKISEEIYIFPHFSVSIVSSAHLLWRLKFTPTSEFHAMLPFQLPLYLIYSQVQRRRSWSDWLCSKYPKKNPPIFSWYKSRATSPGQTNTS